jgi:DNA invertase Pin-like site-specific DNA recombinase
MNPNDLKKIEAYQKEIARLKSGMIRLNRKLLKLPGRFGFKTMGEFIAALKRAEKDAGGKVRGAATVARRKRAVITDEVKAQVKALLGQGKTGAEVAKAVKISLPSVQNIKKALGLVKKRKG